MMEPRSSSLPLEQQQQQSPPRLRALVVDDDADTLVVMGKMLLLIGVEVMAAQSCEAARCAAVGQNGIGLAIADVTLPDGDGLTLLAELKRAHGCRTIAISGWARPAGRLPAGVDWWIEKPVEVARLHGAVRG